MILSIRKTFTWKFLLEFVCTQTIIRSESKIKKILPIGGWVHGPSSTASGYATKPT